MLELKNGYCSTDVSLSKRVWKRKPTESSSPSSDPNPDSFSSFSSSSSSSSWSSGAGVGVEFQSSTNHYPADKHKQNSSYEDFEQR